MAGAPLLPTLACGNCSQPMQQLALQGHYGRAVEIDLCPPCHLVWFDPVESAHLAGPGLLALIGAMAEAHTLAHTPARPGLRCPHCRGPLKTVHNRTRWGASLQLECSRGHGSWQTFAQFLTEKGLLRPLSSADRARAHAAGAVHCINCGGTLAPADERCSWCTSVPALVDVARLARALDPEAATAGHAVHGTATAAATLQCLACGAAQPVGGAWQCGQCGATLAMPGLTDAHRHVSALGPALQAHAARPAPHVVRQRLAAQQGGLERQRERAAEMQAEADERLGRRGEDRDTDLLGWPWPPGPQRWAGIALSALLLVLWWWLG